MPDHDVPVLLLSSSTDKGASHRRKRKADTQSGRAEDESTKASDDEDTHKNHKGSSSSTTTVSIQALVDDLWSNDYETVFGANKQLLELLYHHPQSKANGQKVFAGGGPAYIFMNMKKHVGHVHRSHVIQQCFMLLESLLFLGAKYRKPLAQYPDVIKISVQGMVTFQEHPDVCVLIVTFLTHLSFQNDALKLCMVVPPGGALTRVLATMQRFPAAAVVQLFGAKYLHELLESNTYDSQIRQAMVSAQGVSILTRAKENFRHHPRIQRVTQECLTKLQKT